MDWGMTRKWGTAQWSKICQNSKKEDCNTMYHWGDRAMTVLKANIAFGKTIPDKFSFSNNFLSRQINFDKILKMDSNLEISKF